MKKLKKLIWSYLNMLPSFIHTCPWNMAEMKLPFIWASKCCNEQLIFSGVKPTNGTYFDSTNIYIYIYIIIYISIYLYLYLYIYIFIHRKELACKDWRSNRRMIAFKAWAHRAPGVPHGQLLHGFLINPVRMCKQTLKIAVFFAYVHWKYPLVN